MISSIEQYLAELKKELSGCDRAVIQDALSDAEEYLRTALESAPEAEQGQPPAAALEAIVAKYGAPAEVAAAYKDLEGAFLPPSTALLIKISSHRRQPPPCLYR